MYVYVHCYTFTFKFIYSYSLHMISSLYEPVIWSVFQTFKLFEKLADHDRERLLTELRRKEESQCVPPVAQELEISDESHKQPEEQRVEAAQLESSSSNAVEGSPQATVCTSSETSSSGGGAPAQASAASKGSDQWVKQSSYFFNVIISSHKFKNALSCSAFTSVIIGLNIPIYYTNIHVINQNGTNIKYVFR